MILDPNVKFASLTREELVAVIVRQEARLAELLESKAEHRRTHVCERVIRPNDDHRLGSDHRVPFFFARR